MTEEEKKSQSLEAVPENQEAVEKKDEGPKRFVEKGPWVIHDTKTGLYWLKKDSWQEKQKFFNWHESKEYAQMKNVRKIGGFNDWRMPSTDEATTLFDENLKNVAKGGDEIHIDPVFPEGSFKVQWTMADTSTKRPRFDFTQGKVVHADEYAFGSVRICRKDPVKKDDRRQRRR